MQVGFPLHNEAYKTCIEAAAIAVLLYIAVKDLRTFRIPNASVILLALLYVPYAWLARSPLEIASGIVLAVLVSGPLIYLYVKQMVGGGDLKLVPVVCLWVGLRCALLFSASLLVLTIVHVLISKVSTARTGATARERHVMAYAPSLCGALILTIMLCRYL
jgi:prepilin peptidase CpaA